MTEAEFPNGAMRLYAIIGDPVSQVKSPAALTQRFREGGTNAALVPLHVPAAHLAEVFASLRLLGNLDGMVITVPHKVRMAELVDSVSERARLVGAINLARREADGRWHGDMADGVGFCRGLAANGFDPAGRKAFVLGTGGAGSAVTVELARLGAAVRIHDVAPGRAQGLADRLREAGFDAAAVEGADPAGADLVVNATPLGMRAGDALPIDPALLSPDMFVADVVIRPPLTPFLEQARARGCRVQAGEAVMLHQLDAMVAFFLGAPEVSASAAATPPGD